MPYLRDRSFDLILLSNWEDQLILGPGEDAAMHGIQKQHPLATPANAALESGVWTQSIIWDVDTPFKDFTQVELPEEGTVAVPEPPRLQGKITTTTRDV